MESTEIIAELIKRYMEGNLTVDEAEKLRYWRQADSRNEQLFQRITQSDEIFADALQWIAMQDGKDDQHLQQIKRNTLHKIAANRHTTRWRSWKFVSVTAGLAATLLCITVFTYIIQQRAKVAEPIEAASILPGTNKAELQLSDGQKIVLRTDKDGIMLHDKLTYSDGTPLLALDKQKLAHTTATINVPAGGKYRVTLSDGTLVQLNAQSRLEYPLLLDGKIRKVRVEGEAYFEVAHAYSHTERIPFEVTCKDQIIRVMGTSFNVSAYADDAYTRTTLVEGAIEIKTATGNLTLKPNEQATVQAGHLSKETVDVQQYIAWKDNTFLFYETELRDLMKQLGRWYAIQVDYPNNLPPTYFYGGISREKNLAEVLRILEKAGVKFKLSKAGDTIRLQVIH